MPLDAPPDAPTPREPPRPTRPTLLRRWFGIVLWKRVFLGMALGAVAGLALGEHAEQLKWIGDIFIRLIRMLIVPLVFATIVAGVVSIADVRRLGGIGAKTIFLYLVTTLTGACLGLALGSLIRPGVGAKLGQHADPAIARPAVSLGEQFLAIIPTNPVAALANGEILSIIFFSMLFGISVLLAGERGKPIANAFSAVAEVMQNLTRGVMEVAPFGVFALIAWVVGVTGPGAFVHIFLLAICVLVGCTIQVLFIHGGLLVGLLGRLPSIPFLRDIADAVVVAFSTSSSAASLPVVMRVAEENLGVSRVVASTSLPIGVSVSMDGTAMYVGLLSMFAAQAFGLEVTPLQYALIAVTTVIIALGSGPVPSASLFLLAGVLQVLGLSAEQTALVVGFILPFDRVLDMMRTVPNCTSDLAVAVTVARWEKELDEEVYRAKPTS
ncbi:dicarboxylate/amino acid:cation symporter [Phenylobacterium sp. VNQ135]|uniref:dicarboxylate/amino acid:cation symporter n=1 Tax=Phenylobacterium sp. VNQ135 TaxID=3400922 RepID=UPI003C095B61